MANTDLKEQLVAGYFTIPYQANLIWQPMTTDITGMIGPAESMTFPSYLGETPGNAAEDEVVDISATFTVDASLANITWGDPSTVETGMVKFEMNKAYKINRVVSYVQDHFIRAPLMEAVLRSEARAAARRINKDIRAEVANSVPAANTAALAGVTAANFVSGTNEAFQNNLLAGIREMALDMDEKFVPRDVLRPLILTPRIYANVIYRLRERKEYFTTPVLDNIAIRRELPVYEGFAIIQDNHAGRTVSNTDDDVHTMFAFAGQDTILHGSSFVRPPTVIDSEVYMGRVARGLWGYGTKVLRPSYLFSRTVSIS